MEEESEEDVGSNIADAAPFEREAEGTGHFRFLGSRDEAKRLLLNNRPQQAAVQGARGETSRLFTPVSVYWSEVHFDEHCIHEPMVLPA